MNWQNDLIEYRKEKSEDTLEDARILVERKRFFSAVNRIYYALFYKVIALLQTQNLSSPKHSGVRGLFNKHFIKTGLISVEIGRFYGNMFEFRQKGDYEDFVSFKEVDVVEWLSKAEKYIKELDACIDKQMADSINTEEQESLD